MLRRLAGLAMLLLTACAPEVRAEPLLADWAVLVVAADQTASEGGRTEGFDNARREIAAALIARGARPENLRQLSVEPARDPANRPAEATPANLRQALAETSARARGGCLLYFTSHGDRRGIVLGKGTLTPAEMAGLADAHCAGRPTVAVVSACYSGVFIPALERPERLVLTAARPDRSSFGCGQNDRMPYFDACVLNALPTAPDFLAVGQQAKACVAGLERAGRLKPASEPQIFVGPEMRVALPLLRFDG